MITDLDLENGVSNLSLLLPHYCITLAYLSETCMHLSHYQSKLLQYQSEKVRIIRFLITDTKNKTWRKHNLTSNQIKSFI